MKLYPLQFQPEMKERVWGGRNLERFGYSLPAGSIGEAWTISEHPHGMTKVINGVLHGWGLDQVREHYREMVFGHKGLSPKTGRFPLLVKLLDCEDDLSIQVHPSDDDHRLTTNELGKSEMWYVIDAKPGAKIIFGLKDGTTQVQLRQAIEEDRILEVMNHVEVCAGDAFYIPAGTVHALGAGILLAEIQQNSDTTYRLYDYHRLGLDGKPRALHIEDSLEVIQFEGTTATKRTTELSRPNEWLTIAESPYFKVEKGAVHDKWELTTTADSFIILIITKGEGQLIWDSQSIIAHAGDCFLLPAQLGSYILAGQMTVIQSYIP